MATPRRKLPRPRRPPGDAPPARLWSVSAGIMLVAACMCALNFNGNSHRRREVCTSTCEARLQTAALESHVPPSASPSAVTSLFPRQEPSRQSPFAGSSGQLADGPGHLAQARPRRLPPLIKILTGFGDEPSSSGEDPSAVVRIEKPKFAAKRRREDHTPPASHEDTVQSAAVAAATAVFSKATRVSGNSRMRKVNSEWEAALRWIAGWDQQRQQLPSPLDGRRNTSGTSSQRAKKDDAHRDGFESFVDDLTRMLEECITQCTEDANFEAWQGDDNRVGGETSVGAASVGSMGMKSLLGWSMGSTFPWPSVSQEGRIVMANALRLVSSSLAAYALLSLGSWAYPMLKGWYASLGYSESPEWLLQHEKELKEAKSSRSRQKKKKRKTSGRRSAAVAGAQQEHSVEKQTSAGDPPDHSDNPAGPAQQHDAADDKQLSMPTAAKPAVPESKESVSGSEGVPSMISYTTASVTSSPSTIKPIGSHLEEGSPYLEGSQGPPQPIPPLNATAGRKSPLLPQFTNQKPLSVPTQEQRNEAARQLREFQQAQIQRILLQRKLSRQSSSNASAPRVGTTTASATQGPRLITPQNSALAQTSSFHSQESKVMRPPPGLSHPTEVQPNEMPLVQDDQAFLADNELLLSKLLDDDDEEEDAPAPTPVDLGIDLFAEPSLNPSAAPFVSSTIVESAQEGTKEEKGDAWQQSGPRVSSPVGMKGVYGGSVW